VARAPQGEICFLVTLPPCSSPRTPLHGCHAPRCSRACVHAAKPTVQAQAGGNAAGPAHHRVPLRTMRGDVLVRGRAPLALRGCGRRKGGARWDPTSTVHGCKLRVGRQAGHLGVWCLVTKLRVGCQPSHLGVWCTLARLWAGCQPGRQADRGLR